MGHYVVQLILLFGMLAGASAIPSWGETQEQEHQSFMSELLPDRAFKEVHLEEASVQLTGNVIRWANGTEVQLFPTSKAHMQEHENRTRRRLGMFRWCSPCTCCNKTRRWCLPTMCCYNIKCGLPSLPYGMCSFIPISCAYFGCRK